MKKKYLILLCLAALSLSLSGCGNKEDDATIGSLDVSMSTEDIEASGEAETSEEESESESETELETITIPETTREASESLPDVAIYDDTVLDNYTLEINNAERYTINYPKGYEVQEKDKYKTFLVQENTQIFVYCINDTFESSNGAVSYTHLTLPTIA